MFIYVNIIYCFNNFNCLLFALFFLTYMKCLFKLLPYETSCDLSASK